MRTVQLAATVGADMLAGWAQPSSAQAQPARAAPQRSITHVAGDLYRFQDNAHYGVLLVTSNGVVVADPLNTDTAQWLKGEIASRFNNAKVAVVLYSHFHGDHAAGADAFPDARVLGRPETVSALQPPSATDGLGGLAAGDSNGDGLLQRSEATGVMAQFFTTYDKNGDRALTPREIFDVQSHGVKPPTEIWDGPTHTLSLGGKTVELHHVGGKHAADLSFIYFPAEKALFVVDVISPRRLPNISSDYDESERFATLDKALAFTSDTVVGGHGRIGTEADIEAQRQYLTELRIAVQAAIDAGQTVEQAKANVKMEKYADWIFYREWVGLNVEGMYALLKGPAQGVR
jgi:glyoxylase-like metal-dependent hydrolase (beta-lactamase superfamily II)